MTPAQWRAVCDQAAAEARDRTDDPDYVAQVTATVEEVVAQIVDDGRAMVALGDGVFVLDYSDPQNPTFEVIL